MDAIKIALETVLIGALAVPWLWLGLYLFFPDGKEWIKNRIPTGEESMKYAVAAVIAVAMAYTVGAAMSRLAQDFYNDDDFGLPFPPEDSIRASVYCENLSAPWLFDAGLPLPGEGKPVSLKTFCEQRKLHHAKDRDYARQGVHEIFGIQEGSLLLLGEDKTSQLRHLHQQLLVLQGVGFDGLITWTLCLLAWNAGKLQWGRWRLILPAVIFIYCAFYALLWNHLGIHQISELPRLFWRWEPDDPPFMEFAGMLLAVAGYYLATRKQDRFHKPMPHLTTTPVTADAAQTEAQPSYQTGLLVSFLLTSVAYSGWYWTEILYDRLVIYSFYATQHLMKSAS